MANRIVATGKKVGELTLNELIKLEAEYIKFINDSYRNVDLSPYCGEALPSGSENETLEKNMNPVAKLKIIPVNKGGES